MPSRDEVEVSQLFDSYEQALLHNDVTAMNAAFLHSEAIVRFGVADMQFGFDELVRWRASATPVSPMRRITKRIVMGIAAGVVAVDVTFVDGDAPFLGRQSQTWVNGSEGWRIVRAHVSVIST